MFRLQGQTTSVLGNLLTTHGGNCPTKSYYIPSQIFVIFFSKATSGQPERSRLWHSVSPTHSLYDWCQQAAVKVP
ncbi:hypothetical protein PEC301889_24000 [Pectobacterium carotovorum subsp. carotovorum]|nr:hypothetical protein PEC301889_24000 [Pectobacterium carotovorum subsp. carotovorum]